MTKTLTNAAVLALALVVALRPLVAETYDSSTPAIIAALGSEGNPTPLRTLLFDLSILLASSLVFLGQSLDPRRGRRTIVQNALTAGLLLLVIAAATSCVFAGNKRLAINAAIDWLCCPIAAIALADAMNRTRQRWLLAAIVGSACVHAAACYEQSVVGFSETWTQYLSTKDEFWRNQGVALDDPEVDMFEARMEAREASGLLSHPNVAASLLVLTGMTAIGIATAAGRRTLAGRNLPVAILGVAILSAVILTGSRGAMISAALSLALWFVIARSWPSVLRHRRRIFIASWIAVVMVTAAVMAHGWYHGSLPGASLNFRWQYWTASAQMVVDHPWTGVGRENFGRHYLQYKSIQSPEEVSNPHNLFVQVATEWGVLGLAGFVLLLIGGSWTVVQGWGRREIPGDAACRDPADGLRANTDFDPGVTAVSKHRAPARGIHRASSTATPGESIAYVAAVGAFVVAGRLLLLGSSNPSYLYYTGMTTAILWLAGAIAVWITRLDAPESTIGPSHALGAAMGLLAFLIHDTINFALFVPATATTVFAVFALCASAAERYGTDSAPSIGRARSIGRGDRGRGNRRVGSTEPTLDSNAHRAAVAQPPCAHSALCWLPAGCCLLATIVAVVIGVIPVARAGARLEQARSLVQSMNPSDLESALRQIGDQYRLAAAADPHDPTPYTEWAGLLAWAAGAPSAATSRDAADKNLAAADKDLAAVAEQAVSAAIARDPFSTGLRRLRLSILRDAAERLNSSKQRTASTPASPDDPGAARRMSEAHSRAVAAARDVLTLYRESPVDWVSLGDTCLAAGEATLSTSEEPSPLSPLPGRAREREEDPSPRPRSPGGTGVPEAGRKGVPTRDVTRDEYFAEALAAYRKALSLDDARPVWETFHRMRAKDREAVERNIARIEAR